MIFIAGFIGSNKPHKYIILIKYHCKAFTYTFPESEAAQKDYIILGN